MRIMIPVVKPSLDSRIDQRLGRSIYLLVVDSNSLEFEVFPNPWNHLECNAGIETARFALEQNVDAIISYDVGPKAFAGLRTAKITVYSAEYDHTARQAVCALLAEQLRPVTAPTKEGHGRNGRLNPHRP